MKANRYSIIRADVAGLAVLKEMCEDGFDADCFGKSKQVGGYCNTGFDNFPMPKDYPLHPDHDQAASNLTICSDSEGCAASSLC